MTTVKEKLKTILDEQPADAPYEDIMRELAFEGMGDRGLEDARKGHVMSNDEMGHRIRVWSK